MASSSSRMKWKGQQFIQLLKTEEAKRLNRAAIYVANEVKRSLREKYPPASQAGQPPHLRTGELGRSITHEVDERKLIARVGTNKDYAGYLERGTENMDPRPFLMPAWHASRRVVARILVGKKIV